VILYTPVPIEQVLEGMDRPRPVTMEISLGGAWLQVEPLDARRARVIRLVSPVAQDYLRPEYAPGAIIEWNGFRLSDDRTSNV